MQLKLGWAATAHATACNAADLIRYVYHLLLLGSLKNPNKDLSNYAVCPVPLCS